MYVIKLSMDTKLTLSLSKAVIDRAKKYARKENKSLSKLVEDYFSKLSAEAPKTDDITPLVKKLSGVAKNPPTDHKKDYADYLSKKYR